MLMRPHKNKPTPGKEGWEKMLFQESSHSRIDRLLIEWFFLFWCLRERGAGVGQDAEEAKALLIFLPQWHARHCMESWLKHP